MITGQPASPATARASSVLPVPGGPTSSTPLGHCAPIARKRSGSRRNEMTSRRSARASCAPPTSAIVSMRSGGVVPKLDDKRPPRFCMITRTVMASTPMISTPSWSVASEIRSRSTRTMAPSAPQRSRSASDTTPAGTLVTPWVILLPDTTRGMRNVATSRAPFASTASSLTSWFAMAVDNSEYDTGPTTADNDVLRWMAYPIPLAVTASRRPATSHARTGRGGRIQLNGRDSNGVADFLGDFDGTGITADSA